MLLIVEDLNNALAIAERSFLNYHTLGSPSSRHIGPGIEEHIPTLFLHLSPDDLAHSVPGAGAGLLGWDSLLSREDPESFISLPLLQVIILSSDWLTHIVLSSDWLTQHNTLF